MPAGDPAGYLPNVLKARKRKGQPAYQPRGPHKGVIRGRAALPGPKSGPFSPPASGTRSIDSSKAAADLSNLRAAADRDRATRERSGIRQGDQTYQRRAIPTGTTESGPPTKASITSYNPDRGHAGKTRRRKNLYLPLPNGNLVGGRNRKRTV